MSDKIKVKDVVKGAGTCQHYTVTFDMGDGLEFKTALHAREVSDLDEGDFALSWLKFQFKYNADKTKLKGKVVAEVSDFEPVAATAPLTLMKRIKNYLTPLPRLDPINPLGLK